MNIRAGASLLRTSQRPPPSPHRPGAEWPGQTRWSPPPPAPADIWAPGRQHLGPQTSGMPPRAGPPPSAAAPPQGRRTPPPLDPPRVQATETGGCGNRAALSAQGTLPSRDPRPQRKARQRRACQAATLVPKAFRPSARAPGLKWRPHRLTCPRVSSGMW